MVAKHSSAFGSGFAPIFPVHSKLAWFPGRYFFFHIKITKLNGGWGMCFESGSESLIAFLVETREQSYSF